MKKSQRDSPNESILRPTGADGGRLGPSIIGGGDGAPPLTGEAPYESPVTIRPSIYSGADECWCYSNLGRPGPLSTLVWQSKSQQFSPSVKTRHQASSSNTCVGWGEKKLVLCGWLPWRGPAACPELGLKRGARRSLSWAVITASLLVGNDIKIGGSKKKKKALDTGKVSKH